MSKIPITIGITGHRHLPPESLPSIQQELKSFYEKIKHQHPSTEITVLSSLAEGADMLCAKMALEMGFRLIVPLPMDAQEYRKDFSKEVAAAFDRLLTKAAQVFVVVPEEPKPEHCERGFYYRQAGIYVARHCDILLAIWDGMEKETPDGAGTYETIKLARKYGVKVKTINTIANDSNYKIFTLGGAGGNIANYLQRRDIINNDRIFYFNTDKCAVEHSSLKNQYCIGNLPSCICGGPPHKTIIERVFDEEHELFDSLTNEDSLYILIGAFAGKIGSVFLLKMAELLEKKGEKFVAIGILPFECEGRHKEEKALHALEELQNITSNLIVLPNENIRKLFEDLGIKEAFDKADYYATEVILELLFSLHEKDKIISAILQKDNAVAESIIKIKNGWQ
ncbi:MAG: hypothetical protein LBO74_00640 [Candidatus Symbiothrix sp.]|jgi:hypothetical protein|nr:hypothetical protein [Candidatus Symbiothrix sp.]